MTLPSIADAVGAAVHVLLDADTTLDDWVGERIYDQGAVPDNPTFPYIVLGEVFETPEDAFTQDNHSVLLRIHTWSQYSGKKETLDIFNQLATTLDKAALSVSGATLSRCAVEMKQVLPPDPDGRTTHGIFDLRVQAGE